MLKDPLFRELVEGGLAMRERFSAEPVYAKTGKRHLKSAGLEEIQRVKEEIAKSSQRDDG